jgi:hypothetical protein
MRLSCSLKLWEKKKGCGSGSGWDPDDFLNPDPGIRKWRKTTPFIGFVVIFIPKLNEIVQISSNFYLKFWIKTWKKLSSKVLFWIRIWVRIGPGFNNFVDPDPQPEKKPLVFKVIHCKSTCMKHPWSPWLKIDTVQ